MQSILYSIRSFFRKKISSDRPNVWQKLFLLRKIYLTKFFRVFYSQFGEDVILREFIPKSVDRGFYVDVGCFHPKKFSNTYMLYKRGWRGINVDLDALKVAGFNLARPLDCNIAAAVSDREETMRVFSFGAYSLVSTLDETTAIKDTGQVQSIREIKTRTLTHIIDHTRFAGKRIDLLSIDAEGHDLNVLKSLDLTKYNPWLIVIETHLISFDQIERSELYLYLKGNGYVLINWVGFSLVFTLPDNPLLRADRRVASESTQPLPQDPSTG